MTNALLSIVIPCKNEARNLPPLLDEIDAALGQTAFEVIVVDDGSTDDTRAVLAAERLARRFSVRHLRHERSAGQSIALRSGVFAAHGAIVATLDGDGQNDPRYIPALVEALNAADEGVGLVTGQRLKRQDTTLKRLSSKIANRVRGRVLGDYTRDTGCSLKAMHTALFRQLPFFDGSHRFLPALVQQEGFTVIHIDVYDRPRRFGVSHYGIFDRAMRATVDLLGVWWLKQRRRNLPRVVEIAP
ncbi:MAG: glycosyltransferase family 2 protein [Rhizobiaceae bacterium]|nr:glycosyltransferase family 2 protein [Rhizobiaceae bacterium]